MLVFHENLLNAVIERGGDGKETPMYYIRSLYLEKHKWMNIKGYKQEKTTIPKNEPTPKLTRISILVLHLCYYLIPKTAK